MAACHHPAALARTNPSNCTPSLVYTRAKKYVTQAYKPPPGITMPAPPPALDKADRVRYLLAAKEASGKTFSAIAQEVGLTNVYTTQLFYLQQRLHPDTREKLHAAVPELTEDDLDFMMRSPMRSFDPDNLQEPAIYRLYEAIMHGGEAIKAIINEEFGDSIMSAIDFYATIDKVEGTHGEQRIVITFNGKCLPYAEQRVADNVAQRPPKQ